ncbi:MAG: CorA family divalent cation transporter [Pseudomonadota bacterium]
MAQIDWRGTAPLFGYQFHQGQPPDPVTSLPRISEERSDSDGLLWVHLDLYDPAMLAWLRHLPVPGDVIDAVAEPIQRGRLFAFDWIIYGQLRDLCVPPESRSHALRAGALCFLAIPGLVVTGRAEPLMAVRELRNRIENGTAEVYSPIGLLKAFFEALNDIGEDALDASSNELSDMEVEILRQGRVRNRPDLLRMRREAVSLVREMAYKRTSMMDLLREKPPLATPGEYRALRDQLERYRAQIDDLHDYADRCQFLLDELRAQVGESTNRNLYILTIFSAMFMPATLIAGLFGMNVEWLPFGASAYGFWEVTGIVAVSLGMVLAALRWMRFF